MPDLTLLAASVVRIWYAAPLIVSVSLVYAATRHELLGPILNHAVRFAVWVVVFMLIVAGVLALVSTQIG